MSADIPITRQRIAIASLSERATLALALVLTAPAHAQPMQCGTGIVNPGDSQERVLELCGQPAASKQWRAL